MNRLPKKVIPNRGEWGFKDIQSHHLYLKSWQSIYLPKAQGGLGFRTMQDINLSLLAKQVWTLCSPSDKPWAKLIKAKYLRGKNILEVHWSSTARSWFWGGLRQCIPIIKEEACYQVGVGSELSIRDVPWIHNLPGFKVVDEIQLQQGIQRLKDLIIG